MGLQLSGSIQLEGNLLVTGSANSVFENILVSGKLTAQEIETQFVSASIIYSSGSNKFGDEITDNQQFTGSVDISGSLGVNGIPTFGSVSGSVNTIPKFTGGYLLGDSGIYESGGNVGIGTTSPTGLWSGDNRNINILSIANYSSELVLSRTAGSVGAASISNFLSGTTADFGIYTTAALNYVVYTNNIERMRISSGGNVGIGVTPSAWATSPIVWKGLEIDGRVSFISAKSEYFNILANAYRNNSSQYIYSTSAPATNYGQNEGKHEWYTAPSGTAGNAITFTQAMTLDASGRLGIGGDTPLTKLHLQSSSPNYILLTNTAADGVPNAIQGGIIGQARGFANNLSQMASILFRNDPVNWFKGEISFNTNGTDGTDIAIQPTERMRITSDGFARLSASSGGIQFNGDTAAANALNDYEEGTWTPVLADASTAGNTATGTFLGFYTKIGRLVTLQATCGNITTTGMTGGNTLYIRGLPFEIAGSTQISAGAANFYNVVMGANGSVAWINAAAGTTFIRILKQASGTTNADLIVSDVTTTSGEMSFTITYYA